MKLIQGLIAASMLAAGLGASSSASALDAAAAEKLARKNDCFKCHAYNKTKKGPSYKKIAEKYKGKPEGMEKILTNLTTNPKVKLEDGTEEEHKSPELSKDELNNLAEWILTLHNK